MGNRSKKSELNCCKDCFKEYQEHRPVIHDECWEVLQLYKAIDAKHPTQESRNLLSKRGENK